MNFIYFKKKISDLIYKENAVVRKTFKWQFLFFVFLNFIVFLLFFATFFFSVSL